MKRESRLALLLVIIVAVFLAWRHCSSDTLPVSEARAFPITAEQLYSSYNENEVAADRRYKNRVLAISGTVGEIGKDILNKPYVILQAGYGGGAVQCYFGKGEEYELASLKPGQRVTIKGRCSGQTLGTIVVEECLLQAEPTPLPLTSSTQPPAPVPSNPAGSEAILHVDGAKKVPVAASTDDFYKIDDAIRNGEDAKALAMMRQGKVVMVDNDSPVVVIEPFGYLAKIKLKVSGRVGWVRSYWLQ